MIPNVRPFVRLKRFEGNGIFSAPMKEFREHNQVQNINGSRTAFSFLRPFLYPVHSPLLFDLEIMNLNIIFVRPFIRLSVSFIDVFIRKLRYLIVEE